MMNLAPSFGRTARELLEGTEQTDLFAFEHDDATGETAIGVELPRFDDYLAAAREEFVHLELQAETGTLAIESGGFEAAMTLVNQEYIRSALSADPEEVAEEHTTARYEIGGDLMSELSGSVSLVGSQFDLRAREDRLVAFARGDTDRVTETYNSTDYSAATVEEDAESTYTTELWDSLVTVVPPDSDVTLWFGEETPVVMHYDRGEYSDVWFMLSPRIKA